MATDVRNALKGASSTLTGDALMQARPDVLRGVDAAQQAALETLDVRTVFDLAASSAFAAARRLLRLQDDATQPEAQLQRVAADLVAAPAGAAVAELAQLPIAALKAVGPARAPTLVAALGTLTVRDFALWPPQRAARALLADQIVGDDAPLVGDPGTPPELLPKNGAFPTERVLYRRLLIDSASDAGVQPLEQRADAIALTDVLAGSNQGFTRLATGALLTFSQDWFSQGVALGQLLHCLSLAPGESTRMAMIDWSRQSRGSGSEDIDEAQRLSNTTTHQRALSEVTEATAVEVQGGSTRTTTEAGSSQGGSSLGFELGPVAFGGSSGGGSSTTEALTVTSSFGRRDLAASVAQQINDVSQQQASAARSRRASVVQEVSQGEHQALSTRVVCNYNHMHALNVQYYEVVQAFRVTTTLQRAERVVFVPLKLVDFADAPTLERWRGVLADVALTDDVRRQLTTEFGVVELVPNVPRLRVGDAVVGAAQRGTAIAGALTSKAASFTFGAGSGAARLQDLRLATGAARAGTLIGNVAAGGTKTDATGGLTAGSADTATADTAGGTIDALRELRLDLGPPQAATTLTTLKGFDAAQLSRLASLSSRTLLRNGSDAVFVPDEARLHGVLLISGRASGLAVRRRTGADVPAAARTQTQLSLEAPVRFADLKGVQVQMKAEDVPGPTTLRLLIDIGGSALPLDVPIVLPAAGVAAEVLSFAPVRAAPALLKHLKDNALHYSRAIYARLDAGTLSAALARFTLRGVPLGSIVDPAPVALVANALAFRLNLPLRGAVENPALAAEQQAFLGFLQKRGLDRPTPQSQTVPLPTGGVFAEAVLGRFNSAEKIDLTRFFDWQSSPIPLTPPDIAALPSASRQRAVDLSTSSLGAPVLRQTEATALPAGANSAAILAAMQAGSPFRDLSSVIAANAGLARAGSEVTGAGATAAATQAANTLQTVMAQNTERLKIAADLFTATQGGGQGDAAKAKASPTATGLAMTTADRQDQAVKAGASPSQAAAAAAAGGATLEQQAQSAQTGGGISQATQQAIEQAIAGTVGESTASPATPARPPAQRRGGRRVQTATPSTLPTITLPPDQNPVTPPVFDQVLLEVRRDSSLLGLDVVAGETLVIVTDAEGKVVITLSGGGARLSGSFPAGKAPFTVDVTIRPKAFDVPLTGRRQLVLHKPIVEGVVAASETVIVKTILRTRRVRVVQSIGVVQFMTPAALKALPEMQPFADELKRILGDPEVAVRGDRVEIVFGFFEPFLRLTQDIQ